jgi:hypothetical protein
MSHAMGLSAGIGAHGLWSVSKGLERDSFKLSGLCLLWR